MSCQIMNVIKTKSLPQNFENYEDSDLWKEKQKNIDLVFQENSWMILSITSVESVMSLWSQQPPITLSSTVIFSMHSTYMAAFYHDHANLLISWFLCARMLWMMSL